MTQQMRASLTSSESSPRTWLKSMGYESDAEVPGTPGGGVRRHQRDDSVPQVLIERQPDPQPVLQRRVAMATDASESTLARRAALRRRWPHLVAFALAVASATYVGSSFLPPMYSAGAVVQVTASSGALFSGNAINASNDLAAQFSQLAQTAEVVDDVAREAGVASAEVEGNVSATVLSNQNLILVTAKAKDPDAARKLSAALAKALTKAGRASLNDTVTPVLKRQLAVIDKTIEATQDQANNTEREATSDAVGSARQSVRQAELNRLLNKLSNLQMVRLQLQQDTALRAAEGAVLVADLGPSGPPVKNSPRPVLYALIALTAALVVGAQFLVKSNRNRRDDPSA